MVKVEEMPAKVAEVLEANGYMHDRLLDTYTTECTCNELSVLGIDRMVTIWKEYGVYKVKTTYSFYDEVRTYCRTLDADGVIDCAESEEMYYDKTFVGVVRNQEKRYAEMLLVLSTNEEDRAYKLLLDAIAQRCMMNFKELKKYMDRRE